MQDYQKFTAEQEWDISNFGEMMRILRTNFIRNIQGKQLFTVKTETLWESYMATFGVEDVVRQEQNCNCCKAFIRKYGNICTIDENGNTSSPLWDTEGITSQSHSIYLKGLKFMACIVETSPVNGVFYSKEALLGHHEKGGWNHFAITLPDTHIAKSKIKEAHELRAEKLQEFQIVSRSLPKYSKYEVDQAIKILNAEALYRSDKFMAPIVALKTLHTQLSDNGKSKRNNLVWKFVGENVAGITHITSTVVTSLMDDIRDGLNFDTIKKRFDHKVDPQNYQRPKADASSANIKRGEQIVDKLGCSASLQRRYANAEDLQFIWTPKEVSVKSSTQDSVFGHLQGKDAPKKVQDVQMDPVVITWEKFARKVLPNIESIQVKIPYSRTGFTGMVTATDPDAPIIHKWGNPVSWYVYNGGSNASDWGLIKGSMVDVTGIHYHPSQWDGGDFESGVVLTLKGAVDQSKGGNGLALFPETLIPELHEVRKTIEQFSGSGTLGNVENPTGNGINAVGCEIHVKVNGMVTIYNIDRLD